MLKRQLKLYILVGRLIESVMSMYYLKCFEISCEMYMLFDLITLTCMHFIQEGTFNLCEYLQRRSNNPVSNSNTNGKRRSMFLDQADLHFNTFISL